MSELSDRSVDLIVSGPPYWDYIDYDSYAKKCPSEIATWRSKRSYEEYLLDLLRWYTECFRVLRNGRYCVVNLGTVRRKGRCYPIPFHAVPILEKIGFEFCYEIIWHKVSGGRKDARLMVRDPYPGRYLPNNRIDYLLIFRKQSDASFHCNDATLCDESNRIAIDDLFKCEISNNVWHILPACHDTRGAHPCPFPPEIPHRLIQLLSLRGELILDPFMGIGTTARAARMLGRHFIGYEKQPEFVERAQGLINRPLRLRRPTICEYSTLGMKTENRSRAKVRCKR